MRQYLDIINQFFTSQRTIEFLQALLIFFVGLVVAKVATSFSIKLLKKKFTIHEIQLFRRGIFYGILSLFVFSALNQMGFNLSVLLGAAGIFSVALGFASQTSASNLISGLFLLGERPFSVGDIIRVGATSGEVLSIDLLSVKLRTIVDPIKKTVC